MAKRLLAAGLAIGGLIVLAQSGPLTGPGFLPVQTIKTVEARHRRDVPSLNREDLLAYERMPRTMAPRRAAPSRPSAPSHARGR